LPSAASLAADTLPAKNLQFEQWDLAGAEGYRARGDCEVRPGRCVLRLESLEGAATPGRGFIPLTQSVPASTLAGHGLRLSGWIRTRDVHGWAGLWMRVDAPGRPPVAFDNMEDRGPRGTSEWRRFELLLPVAPGASAVFFGVLLAGTGTAWFDDLELEVDRSVRAAPLPEVVSPPRPTASQALAADAALALAPAGIPAVRSAWRDDVRRRSRAIRSLFSDDFADLRFLKPILAGRRLVMLGETSHGVAEFNWLKARLIRFLHRELGFDVVAFESSMSACHVANGLVGRAAPEEVMRACLHSVWQTTETRGLFEYLDAERKAGRRLALAGFDTQPSGPSGTHGEIPARIAAQELKSRAAFARQMEKGATPEGSRIRDEAMADNLEFLLDHPYAGRKIVAWAHNTHVAKSRHGAEQPESMGAWLAKRRDPAEVYSIGIYMGHGVASTNLRKPYEFPPPEEGSFDAVLANGGWRVSFVDFSRASAVPGADWMFSPIAAREWGTQAITLVPAATYDGVIYVDTVTPPEYLSLGGVR
jgi:erythromycin esterase